MSAADMLLAKLDAVRSTGRDRWIARCPAHEDRRPSLSIRAAESGVLLVYCRAGCAVHEVAAAVGLDLADLFPPRAPDVHSRRPRASSLTPLVATFELDLLLVHVLLADLGAGKPIPPADQVSAKAAASRGWDALQSARYVI